MLSKMLISYTKRYNKKSDFLYFLNKIPLL